MKDSNKNKDVAQFVLLGKTISSQPRRNGILTMPGKYKPRWYDPFVEPALYLAMILAAAASFLCFAYSFLMLSRIVNG